MGFGRLAFGMGSTDIRSVQLTQSRLGMEYANGLPRVLPKRRPALHVTRSRSMRIRRPLP